MTIDIDEILEFAKASGFSTDEEGNIYYDINEFESIDITKELLNFCKLLKLKNYED